MSTSGWLAGILQGLETIKILLYFYYLHKQKAKEMEMISFKDVPQNQRRNLSGQPWTVPKHSFLGDTCGEKNPVKGEEEQKTVKVSNNLTWTAERQWHHIILHNYKR